MKKNIWRWKEAHLKKSCGRSESRESVKDV